MPPAEWKEAHHHSCFSLDWLAKSYCKKQAKVEMMPTRLLTIKYKRTEKKRRCTEIIE